MNEDNDYAGDVNYEFAPTRKYYQAKRGSLVGRWGATLCTTRAEAKEMGHRFYQTGELCKHGHDSKRYTNNGVCWRCATVKAAAANGAKEYHMAEIKRYQEFYGEKFNDFYEIIDGRLAEKKDGHYSLKEAAAAGHKIYVADKPCRHGHRKLRYVKTKICVECQQQHYLRRKASLQG